MNTAPEWPKGDADVALEMWLDGMTGGQISKAMDYKYTRSAIIGKMNRMGYVRNPTVPTVQKAGRYKRVGIETYVANKHSQGQLPASIANMLKVPTKKVLEVMASLGLNPRENVVEHFAVHPMWSMSEDDRRAAFYAKFMAGWKEVQKRLEA